MVPMRPAGIGAKLCRLRIRFAAAAQGLGVLVRREDPTDLAKGIIHVLTRPALRTELVAGGKSTLRRYDEASSFPGDT